MKKVVIALLSFSLVATLSYAETKSLQFRLVLSQEEAESVPHDVYSFKLNKSKPVKEVFVGKEVVLSNEDIKELYIIRAQNRYKQYPEAYKTITKDGIKTVGVGREGRKGWYESPEIRIVFTPQGAKKLEEFSKKNTQKSCAVVFDGKLLCMPMMMFPLTAGKIGIESVDIPNDEIATDMVKQLGFEPKYLDE